MDGGGQIIVALICEKLTIKHMQSDYSAVIGKGVTQCNMLPSPWLRGFACQKTI